MTKRRDLENLNGISNRLQRIQAIEWDAFLSPTSVKSCKRILKRIQRCNSKISVSRNRIINFSTSIIARNSKNDENSNSCELQELILIKQQLSDCRKSLVDEMVICHGNPLQTVLENKTKTSLLHKIVYTNVLKTLKTRFVNLSHSPKKD